MIRSAVAADVLAQIQACFGDRCRGYRFARTRGLPPADCDSIAAMWVDRVPRVLGDCDTLRPCGVRETSVALRITITRVCVGPDERPVFDWTLEDAEAACFEDDLEILEQCLQCSDWTQLAADHQISGVVYTGTKYDIESSGGGFSAHVELEITATECCT